MREYKGTVPLSLKLIYFKYLTSHIKRVVGSNPATDRDSLQVYNFYGEWESSLVWYLRKTAFLLITEMIWAFEPSFNYAQLILKNVDNPFSSIFFTVVLIYFIYSFLLMI